jgi:hypothetical protein
VKLMTTCNPTIVNGSTDEFAHDAAMAHALVMALGELGVTRDGIFAECCQASDTRQFVFERADELMTEWGYTED